MIMNRTTETNKKQVMDYETVQQNTCLEYFVNVQHESFNIFNFRLKWGFRKDQIQLFGRDLFSYTVMYVNRLIIINNNYMLPYNAGFSS